MTSVSDPDVFMAKVARERQEAVNLGVRPRVQFCDLFIAKHPPNFIKNGIGNKELKTIVAPRI